MDELIKIYPYRDDRIVNARDLHTFLESKRRFGNWITDRITKYGFIEGQDFVFNNKIVINSERGRPEHKYGLYLDMAKEIAMVEGNHKGKMARQYFIECEKRYREQIQTKIDLSDPNHVLRITQEWANEHNLRIAAEKKIEVMQPKADLMDKVMDMDDMVDVGQAAKLLKLPFGRNTLYEKLRDKGIFFKNRNEPMQEYVDRGYFDLRQKLIKKGDNSEILVTKVLVNQKGLDFIDKTFGVHNQLSLL